MAVPELVIRARRVVTEDGVRPATVTVADGVITDVGPYEAAWRRLDRRASVIDLADDEVLLPGLVEGLVPIVHARTDDAIEEERRLLYVAVTRAREHLYLSWSPVRTAGTPAGRGAAAARPRSGTC